MATQADVAAKLGISDRWLRKLVEDAVVSDPGRGKWDTVATARQLLDYRSGEIDRLKAENASLRAQQQRADGDTANKGLEDARLARAKADKAEMEAGTMRGDLIPADQVADVVHGAVMVMKTRLLAMPAKIAPLVHAASTIAVAESLIREQVEDALLELSRTKVVGDDRTGAARA